MALLWFINLHVHMKHLKGLLCNTKTATANGINKENGLNSVHICMKYIPCIPFRLLEGVLDWIRWKGFLVSLSILLLKVLHYQFAQVAYCCENNEMQIKYINVSNAVFKSRSTVLRLWICYWKLAINSLFVSHVGSSYFYTNICKFESS